MAVFAGDLSASAQDQTGVDGGAYSHRFLDALPQGAPGGVSQVGGRDAADDAAGKVDVFPHESEVEREERENIRSVLRLLDGDNVQISKDVHVRLVGVQVPDAKNPEDRIHFEKFAREAKSWLEKFIVDPENAVEEYTGMKTGIRYNDKEGGAFVYYYLYVPEVLLDDVRKEELKRYDDWVKKRRGELPEETAIDRADAAAADLKQRSTASADKPKDVKEYLISEAKYYYDDGALKREEIFRDGKLMIRRTFDHKGEIIDEVFFDSRAHSIQNLKG